MARNSWKAIAHCAVHAAAEQHPHSGGGGAGKGVGWVWGGWVSTWDSPTWAQTAQVKQNQDPSITTSVLLQGHWKTILPVWADRTRWWDQVIETRIKQPGNQEDSIRRWNQVGPSLDESETVWLISKWSTVAASTTLDQWYLLDMVKWWQQIYAINHHSLDFLFHCTVSAAVIMQISTQWDQYTHSSPSIVKDKWCFRFHGTPLSGSVVLWLNCSITLWCHYTSEVFVEQLRTL